MQAFERTVRDVWHWPGDLTIITIFAVENILWGVIAGIVCVAIVVVVIGPLVWWRRRRLGEPTLGKSEWSRIAGVIGLFLVACVVLNLPRIGYFAELSFNWQNKILLAILLLVLIRTSSTLSASRVGLVAPKRGWWLPVLGCTLLGLALGALAESTPASGEAIAFQAIVPGIDEELLYRGVMLALIDQALRPRWQIWQGSVGWSAVAVALLFGLVHGLQVSSEGVTFDLAYLVITSLLGVIFIWIRIRWGSLYPAILAHNGVNVAIVVATHL